MSELGEVIRLVETVRTEMRENRREVREDLREIKQEVKRTNGRVTDQGTRIAVLETKEESEDEGRKRWRDWVPTAVTMLMSCALSFGLSVLAYALFLSQ